MNSDELYTLKSMVLDNYEQYHDGLRILLESDKWLYKAFGQSPRTKVPKDGELLPNVKRTPYIHDGILGFMVSISFFCEL